MSDLSFIKDAEALEQFGKGFIKLPRSIGKLYFSEKEKEHILGKMYFSLIYLCNFADGYAILNGEKISCRAGEYVCTHRILSAKTHINIGSISRVLRGLSDLNLIEISPVDRGSRIRVCGYAQFIQPSEANVKKPTPPKKAALPKKPIRDFSFKVLTEEDFKKPFN